MRVAEADIAIDAPLEVVWGVMLDLDAYGAWNPFIVRVDRHDAGTVAVGSRFTLRVRWRRGGGASSNEVVTRLDPPSGTSRAAHFAYRFTGPLDALGLVRAVRVQELTDEGGATRYRTREEFNGFLQALLPMRDVRDGFVHHARALKERAESLARSR